MRKLFFLYCLYFTTINSGYSAIFKHDNPFVAKEKNVVKTNYNYFSEILVYPLDVTKNINILNGGNKIFTFFIYDTNQKLIMSFNASPFCSSKINISTFESGKYIIKASNNNESHQFIFYKE